jgi:hypothetical protein
LKQPGGAIYVSRFRRETTCESNLAGSLFGFLSA